MGGRRTPLMFHTLRFNPKLTVLLAALAVRLIYVLVQVKWRFFNVTLLAPDSERYLSLARNLLHNGMFSYDGRVPTAADVPGYPLFLAGFLALCGENLILLYLLQALLSWLTVVMVYWMARRLWSERAGLWAMLLAAMYPMGFVYAASPLSDVLYAFLAVALLTLYVCWGGKPWGGLAAGLAGGAAVMTRPILGCFLAFLALAQLLHRATVKKGLFLALGVLLVASPWVWRNAQAFGRFIPLSSRGGFEFYLGNAPDSSGGSGGNLAWQSDVKVPPGPAAGQSESAWSAQLCALAVQGLRENPGLALARLPGKIWNMWRPTWEGSSWRNWIFLGGTYLVMAVLALYAALSRRTRQGAGLLSAYVLYHVVVHAVIFGIIRYRVPVEPALCALAGAGLAVLLPGRRAQQSG